MTMYFNGAHCVCEGPHIALLLEAHVAAWPKSKPLEQKMLLQTLQTWTGICLRTELLVPYYRLFVFNSEALNDICF
jgi:hypothetical protein